MTAGNVIVVDLDGTLCNCQSRDHYAKAGLWDQFHEMAWADRPHEDVLGLLKDIHLEVLVVICTGRPEDYREDTEQWLADNGVPFDVLLMRPSGDFRSDAIVKPELLDGWLPSGTWRGDPLRVRFILEDRYKMVNKWRELGFNCWRVRPGAY